MSSSYEQITVGEIILAGIPNHVGAEDVSVLLRNSVMDILYCTGLVKPTDHTAGYAKGCLFIDTDEVDHTTGLYVNIGTNLLCDFDAVADS